MSFMKKTKMISIYNLTYDYLYNIYDYKVFYDTDYTYFLHNKNTLAYIQTKKRIFVKTNEN